jgi:hypothetical protein
MRRRSGSPIARRQGSRSSRVSASTVRGLDVAQAPAPHRVLSHQSCWVRVRQATEITRTFVLGAFPGVVHLPYGLDQGPHRGRGA